MLALVPSSNRNSNSNTNTEKVCDKLQEIHDEFRTIKTYIIQKEQDNNSEISYVSEHNHTRKERTDSVLNRNTIATVSFNQVNSDKQTRDETMFEQLYHFQQNHEGIPINSTRQRHPEGMPIISMGASYTNRNRQSANDNNIIQLPLIETQQSRPIPRNSMSRKTTEPLGVLPLKRRRNPLNSRVSLTSEDTKRGLIHLPERSRITSESPSIHDSSFHSKTSIRDKAIDEFNVSAQSNNLLSRPLPTSDRNPEYKKKTFRLVIQNGVTDNQSEDFLQYQQCYSFIWDYIIKIFRMLEKVMCNYTIPLALINGERVAELAQTIEVKRRITSEELLSTIINRDEIERLIKQPIDRRPEIERAAIIIQSHWRSYCACKYLLKQKRAACVIESAWLVYMKLSKIRNELKLIRQRQLDLFHLKQNELRDKWSDISSDRRVIVHIPSLGLTKHVRKKIKNLSIRENYQIGRLCELEDPNVDVIYVSPMAINDEILQYYNKLINLRALVEQGNEQPLPSASINLNERYTIVVPEALHSFPTHNMCLSTLLKYSPKALKQIKTFIKNRPAYIVTSVSHIDDLYISEYLDIPIFGCEPEVSYLYSTKSGSKRIFESSDIPMPYGEFDIYSEKHLFESLARLIINHLDVQRWLFKIDDYFDGLGIAYCDIATHLPCYKDILKEAVKFNDKSAQKESYRKILSELPDVLNKHTIYVNKIQFNSWQNYLKTFLSQGGIIEAYPPSDSVTSITICLSIEPNGHQSIICSGDQLHAESQFSCWGLAFPQSSVNPNELNSYCLLISEQCKQRNIYGYIDIDFILFIDTKTEKQKLWVIDLSIGYSEHVSLYRVMRYITTGQFNSQTHSFTIKTKQAKQRLRNWQNGAPEYTITEKKRFAVWSSRLYHSNLSNLHYGLFFQICRSHGIGFDIREKQGSIFTLLECDHHENLGMITISDTLQNTLANFVCYLNAIYQEISTTEIEERSNFMLAINDIENILGVTQENASDVSSNMTTS